MMASGRLGASCCIFSVGYVFFLAGLDMAERSDSAAIISSSIAFLFFAFTYYAARIIPKEHSLEDDTIPFNQVDLTGFDD